MYIMWDECITLTDCIGQEPAYTEYKVQGSGLHRV